MADTRCYKNYTTNGQWRLNDISQGNTICPGTQQEDGFSRCCGNSAICLSNNICQALNPAPGGSGFYVGSCTDRDYNSPACPNFCSTLAVAEITYNETSERWQCCGLDADGRLKCDNPTDRRSQAPAPTALLQQYSASVSTFTASSTTSASSSISTSTTTPTPTTIPSPGDDSEGLSTGAKIGAGVGGAVGGVIIIALIFFFFWRRRQPRQRQMPVDQPSSGGQGQYYDMSKQLVSSPPSGQPPGYGIPLKTYIPPSELSPQTGQPRSELPDTARQMIQSPQELPS